LIFKFIFLLNFFFLFQCEANSFFLVSDFEKLQSDFIYQSSNFSCTREELTHYFQTAVL
jgi:hypothetical protein